MNLKNFTEQQQQALLDLATLAMYADGHQAASEDDRIARVLTAMGFTTEYDRGKHFDASISRISRHSNTAAAARAHAVTLTQNFKTRDERKQVLNLLEDLLGSDSKVTPQENNFLSVVRKALEA